MKYEENEKRTTSYYLGGKINKNNSERGELMVNCLYDIRSFVE